MVRRCLLGLLLLPVCAVAQTPFLKEAKEGYYFDLNPGRLWLIPYSDHVLRVVVTAGDTLSKRQSLSVIAKPKTIKPTILKSKNEIGVVFGDVTAFVDWKTRRLRLSAKNGGGISEALGKARSLSPITLDGERTYALEQRFDLPKNQAFYGLGCYQLEDLNLVGETINMVQDNTMDVNPMMVSTGGYGILWDNASATKIDFGGNRGLIPAANLYSKEKRPGGLSAEYYKGRNFEAPDGLDHVKWQGPIDFIWKGLTNFSVRWEGYVKTGPAGTYKFIAETDDGARVWVNGKKLIEDWRDKPVSPAEGQIDLPANTLVPIRFDYYQNGYDAEAHLKWNPPVTGKEIKIQSEVGDQIDYYFFAGPSLDRVVAGYREATGTAPMFGKWAYGLWQCKERYQTQQELVDIVAGYRQRQIPLDNIVQDWFYWDPFPWGSHKFDPKRYPDMAGALKTLHDQYHAHAMISVWAKFAPGSENYDELNSKGLLYPDAQDWSKNGERYYDSFNPEGRAVYWRQMKERLFNLGIDAWWLDATEPEINMATYRTYKTALGSAARVLNAFSLKTTEAVYKGQRAATSNKRVFILTRSVFAGQQRNGAATWSGDIQGTWDVFRRNVAGGLDFCMAGVPYWCTDIGGFFSHSPDDPGYRELFTRWFEWGTFNPIFRVHGTGANKELWRFGPDIQKTLVKYDNLRYRLMPYIYSLGWMVTSQGYTMMRALPMDFRTDERTWNAKDQLMFGPALLVSPVVQEGKTSRSVYLPKGSKWYDFWTGTAFQGGQSMEVRAPLDLLPIHVRAGSIIPMGPFTQYASEKPADPIELRIYPGADGHFTLYEDEGDGYGYEKGARATISFDWNDKRRTLHIGKRNGSFPGMLRERSFRVVIVGAGLEPAKPNRGERGALVTYDGRAVQLQATL